MGAFAGHGVSGRVLLSLSRAWWSPFGFDLYFAGVGEMSCWEQVKGKLPSSWGRI